MRDCVFILALLLTSSVVQCGWYNATMDYLKKWHAETEDALYDFMIVNKMPEKYIGKPLPPDWIPNKDPRNRTPETQAKWEKMEKERLEEEKFYNSILLASEKEKESQKTQNNEELEEV